MGGIHILRGLLAEYVAAVMLDGPGNGLRMQSGRRRMKPDEKASEKETSAFSKCGRYALLDSRKKYNTELCCGAINIAIFRRDRGFVQMIPEF